LKSPSGKLITSGLKGDHSEQIQAVGVMGIEAENLLAKPFGFPWLAEPVSSNSIFDHALNGRGWALPQSAALLSCGILIAFHRYQSPHSDRHDPECGSGAPLPCLQR